eukprot:TRINITY_DN13660_c0_g1_i2.p1 TRINITY_DN13660_c0_g1~~TRINITY_DN13660_c0_g1_i2.p1  ORF type:complete len:302 (-),score=66.10 TRINITY_DN13660_c0_g1_i2:21-926(-)
MLIYDSIILERRVLFVSSAFTTRQVGQYVCAAALLVSPPLFGVLGRVFPYCVWEDLGFLGVKGYVAGSKSEVFRTRSNWFDVCCDLDTGVIIEESKEYAGKRYYKDDMEFIEQLLIGDKTEEEIRYAFSEYTRIILEFAMNDTDYYSSKEARKAFIENQWARIFALRRTFCKETLVKLRREKELIGKHVTLAAVEEHVKKLRLSSARLSSEEQRKIFSDINEFVKVPEQRHDFLALLPKYNEGMHLIGIGLFSSNPDIVSIILEIMAKLKEQRVGIEIISNLNINIQDKYYDQASLIVSSN